MNDLGGGDAQTSDLGGALLPQMNDFEGAATPNEWP